MCAKCPCPAYTALCERSHGLLDDSIYVNYRAVVIAKLTYVSSAWWGFTTADDRQRLEAVIRRGIRSRLCNPDQTTLAEMIEQADDVLFSQALKNNHHALHTLLPNKLEITYQLRHRSHNLTLPRKYGSTTQCDFITRMLFKDSY